MREIPIRLSQFVIGRDPECHLRPASPLVSKRHCAILVREGKVFLRDFDSTNGTFLNQEPLKGEKELKDGDEVKVGPLQFQVKITADEPAEAVEKAPATKPPSTVKAVDKPTPAPATKAPAKAVDKPTPAPATKAPAKAAEPPAKPAEEPAKPAAAAAKKGSFDEDSLIEMLFDDEGGVRPAGPGDAVPTGSTIMEGLSLEGMDQQNQEKKPEAKKKDEKKITDPAATANAAAAILDKYRRRPRT
jgi:predicted component of type VI protein secretion system